MPEWPATAGAENPVSEAGWLLEDVSGLSAAELLADAHETAPERAAHALGRTARDLAPIEPDFAAVGRDARDRLEHLGATRAHQPREVTALALRHDAGAECAGVAAAIGAGGAVAVYAVEAGAERFRAEAAAEHCGGSG